MANEDKKDFNAMLHDNKDAASVRPLCLHSVTSSIHSSRERPGARFLLIMKPPNVVIFYLLSSGV